MDVTYSIVVTAYNYETFIKECVDSCLNQTTSAIFEVIVVDDGSTDNTAKILSSYEDTRLSCYTIENSGIEGASNFGFKKAKGRFVVRVDADDVLEASFLETMLVEMEKYDADFYYPNYLIIDNFSQVKEKVELPAFNKDEVLERGDFLATGTVFKKSDLEGVGLYSEKSKNCGLENYELLLKLLNAGLKGKLVPSHLFRYRRHSLNLSEIKRDKIIQYGRDLFKRLELGEFKTNKNHPYKLTLE